jgi:hypothetical protein
MMSDRYAHLGISLDLPRSRFLLLQIRSTYPEKMPAPIGEAFEAFKVAEPNRDYRAMRRCLKHINAHRRIVSLRQMCLEPRYFP